MSDFGYPHITFPERVPAVRRGDFLARVDEIYPFVAWMIPGFGDEVSNAMADPDALRLLHHLSAGVCLFFVQIPSRMTPEQEKSLKRDLPVAIRDFMAVEEPCVPADFFCIHISEQYRDQLRGGPLLLVTSSYMERCRIINLAPSGKGNWTRQNLGTIVGIMESSCDAVLGAASEEYKNKSFHHTYRRFVEHPGKKLELITEFDKLLRRQKITSCLSRSSAGILLSALGLCAGVAQSAFE